MPFLLLTQGDPIGLDLLKKLVERRYGGSPPALDALRVTYRGWTAARLGPLPLRAGVEAVATYRFPFQIRWDFTVRMLRVLSSRYTTSFDGRVVYEEQSGRVTRSDDAAGVDSARARAWSEAVYFVSPMIADHNVRVQSVGAHAFQAFAPGAADISALVRLNEDYTLAAVEIERLDPSDNRVKLQRLRPAGELVKVDGLILPEHLERYWDDVLAMRLSPVKVELNPALEPDTFTLKSEDLLAVLREDEDAEADAEESGAPD